MSEPYDAETSILLHRRNRAEKEDRLGGEIILITRQSRRRSPACLVIAGAAALMMLQSAATATPITGTGTLNAGNGSVFVEGNGITTGCIDFYNTGSPTACQTGGSGTFTVDGGSTNPPFVVNTNGTIQNLAAGETFPVTGFMSVDGVTFDLTDIRTNGSTPVGDCALNNNTPLSTCTPANSPFSITNGAAGPSGVADTASVDLTMDLNAYTGSSSTGVTPYVGVFTTQGAINDATIGSILTTIASGGFITASWSATFNPSPVPTVPEPGSYLLCGSALIGIAWLTRRFRRRERTE